MRTRIDSSRIVVETLRFGGGKRKKELLQNALRAYAEHWRRVNPVDLEGKPVFSEERD